jgi:hypothetical protein
MQSQPFLSLLDAVVMKLVIHRARPKGATELPMNGRRELAFVNADISDGGHRRCIVVQPTVEVEQNIRERGEKRLTKEEQLKPQLDTALLPPQPKQRGSGSRSTLTTKGARGLSKLQFQAELLRVTDPRSNKFAELRKPSRGLTSTTAGSGVIRKVRGLD